MFVSGIATGFEATVRARVRAGNGHQLASTTFMCGGGAGEMGCFQIQLALARRPPTPNGFVEVFEDNPAYPDPQHYGGPVREVNKVIVPVVFGTHLVDGFVGYRYRVVVDGDTLSRIAEDEYGTKSKWRAIYEANRDQIGDADLPTRFGHFRVAVFEDVIHGDHHVALVKGDVAGGEPILVRAHSQCLTGDTFGSLRCDCGEQLHRAREIIDRDGRGVVLYILNHEGRGIGLMN